MKYVVAIDQGTTGTRCMLFDRQGRVHAAEYVEHEQIYPRQGWVEHDAQEIWVCSTEFFPYEDEGVSYNEMWGKEPVSDPFHYPEWDNQIQLARPDWVTVYERRQPMGDPDDIHNIITEYKPIAHRIKQIIDLLLALTPAIAAACSDARPPAKSRTSRWSRCSTRSTCPPPSPSG